MTDCKQLAYEARQGSKEAFAQLYQAVYQDLYRFALYVLKNRRMPRMRWPRQWQMPMRRSRS